MEIVFALLVLALIVLGLRNRRKEKKEWVREERFDESGAWIDKRSGERGTYGSLDEEMESNRSYISRQGKVSALAQSIQTYCFEQIPDFSNRSDAALKRHFETCKSEINGYFAQIDTMLSGKGLPVKATTPESDSLRDGLKKRILDGAYEYFPGLLDLEIHLLQQFDMATAQMADRILAEIGRQQG